MLNSFSFCLSVEILISPSNMNKNLDGWSILACRFFPFITLNISCHFLLACRVSAEKSADSFMGVPLYVICCFSLIAFNILSLSLIFVILITMCLGMFLFGLILYWTLCASWTRVTVSFSRLGKFSAMMSQIFSQALSPALILLGPLQCKY